ncbi:MAG TPA: YggS family pyridoxal phosphate-dependent enzyme [Burkholderiales bacterium]|nr:YggS family pyridoxal phosphate-dependent enzyme [Burkholderiales bacterium]
MDTIEKRLQAVKSRIARACAAAGRDPRDIVLVAVSKTFPPADVRAAHAAGQRDFGENQAQEAVAKMARLADLDLAWHFIGPVQSNKTRPIAERFAWVHSVDRLKIAERLSAQRPEGALPLQVCIQVNVSGEATKSGVPSEEVRALARAVAALPRLRLRGLMAVPEPTDDVALQRRRFETLRELKERLVADGLALDSLSMGMSDDLEAAIAAGATMVRVGTAIFGARSRAATAEG